jgi:iron complex outermembrane receptor protein
MCSAIRFTRAWLACACLAALQFAHAQTPAKITIPEGTLERALELLVEKTGIQLLYDVKHVAGLRTRGVRNASTPEAAVAELLEGTPLTIKTDASGAILIAAPNAAQSSSREGAEPDTWTLAEIIVTGSRLRRAGDEGPSPVIVVDRSDIDRSGASTTREVLNAITQSSVAPDESGNNAVLAGSSIQLRGLPVGTTLILLNGRRLGASAAQVSANFFDLNNIPLEAVERLEILTDSASAVYGADAIGGAVNIILREDFDGIGAGVRYGTSSEGDATERSGSLTLGGASESFSGMILFDVFDREPLRATDRDLTSTYDFSRFGGPDARSVSAYPGNVYSLTGDPLPGLTSTFAAVPAGTNGIGLTPADFSATDGTLRLFDQAPYATLIAEADRRSVFATGRYTASPAFKLFAEGLYTDRDQIVQFSPDFSDFGEFGTVVVPATNPFNPFGEPVGVDYRFTEIGPRANDSTTDFSRFLLGAEGEFAQRFDWQVYVLTDREHTEIFNDNDVDLGAMQAALDQTDPQLALNVFSTTGNNSPATLASVLNETTDDLTVRGSMAEAVLRGRLLSLPGGPVSAALGVNIRREDIDFLSPLAGDFRFDRNSEAAFFEVSVPLVGPEQQVPAIHALALTAAVRHDRYDDLESLDSTTPQFGLTWRPVQSLLVRSSYGEAFKAPTVFNLFFPPVTFPGAGFDPFRGNQLEFFNVVFSGNTELEPEEGESLTAGFVWEPQAVPGFAATVNAFRLEQTNFITQLSLNTLIANPDLFPGHVVRAPPSPADIAQGFPGPITSVSLSSVNFGRLIVRGADFLLQYTHAPTSVGEFVGSLGGTYIDEYEILLTPDSEPTNEVGHANDAGYPTRFKGYASVGWNGPSGWSASVTTRYLASYTDYDGVSELPSQTRFDAQAGYRFGSRRSVGLLAGLEATLGVINLTDEQGSFSNNFNNTTGYDPQQADIRGRFYYLGLKAQF